MRLVKGKLFVSAKGFPHGGPLYLMSKNGKNVKKITPNYVNNANIKNGYIYFQEVTYGWDVRKCRCKLNGSGYIASSISGLAAGLEQKT
ncbi:MAG: hypothetical protein Q4D55_06990 [Eubacteriales bacterium]|nr:hypothetical protein [Eubacteriales bacterium]